MAQPWDQASPHLPPTQWALVSTQLAGSQGRQAGRQEVLWPHHSPKCGFPAVPGESLPCFLASRGRATSPSVLPAAPLWAEGHGYVDPQWDRFLAQGAGMTPKGLEIDLEGGMDADWVSSLQDQVGLCMSLHQAEGCVIESLSGQSTGQAG